MGLEPISLVVITVNEYVKHRDDADWTKHCMVMLEDGIQQNGRLKTQQDGVREDINLSLALPRQDTQVKQRKH